MQIQEAEPLLVPPSTIPWSHKWIKWIGLGILFSLLSGLLILNLFIASTNTNKPVNKINVILLISDGYGPASETLARQYLQYITKNNKTMLPLDSILVGTSRTKSFDSFITDSAAGATAFSCGIKTYNGAIGVDPQHAPCGTVLEAAKASGYLTGLVATSRITHATPASFAAHTISRDMESDIALYEIGNYTLGRSVDLMFGGGLCFFKPLSANGSCRLDDISVLQRAVEMGWSIGTDKSFFDTLDPHTVSLPLLNLFASDHMSYEVDRNASVQPSLKEMSSKALEILVNSAENTKGFFLMIEGSRIDMASHTNDPVAHLHDILAYQDTISIVKQFVDAHPNTVLISISDHETGGISVGHQLGPTYPVYEWYPSALEHVQHSAEFMTKALLKLPNGTRADFIKDTIMKQWLHISDYTLQDVYFLDQEKNHEVIEGYMGHLVSDRAGLGWSTHGHSAVDVNLYAYGNDVDFLKGNHENTDIGEFIASRMGLDLSDITRKLKSNWKPQDMISFLKKKEKSKKIPRHFHSF